MRLVRNEKRRGHRAAVEHVLVDADQISLAVAFLKDGGARIIEPLLEKCLKQGAAAEAFVGTDFYITEPKALERLLGLRKRFPRFEIFLANKGPTAFHPKTYVGRKGGRVRCLIGSANLTAGAMATNDELSIFAEVGSKERLSSELDSTFRGFRDDPRFQLLEMVLEQYRSNYEVEAPERRKLDENLPMPFDLGPLDNFIRQYRGDQGQRDALKTRRRSRKKALKIQDEIVALHKPGPLSKTDKEAFKDKLCDLMSSKDGRPHHWPSGGIVRQGSKALSYPKETIALFAEGQKAAKLTRASGYEAMRKLALKIPGVGSNMITEILCTFDPDRFAVFNGNTAGALKAIGVAAPRGPTLASLPGKKYVRLCEIIDAVRVRLGTADFTDVDAFLNWLYFKTKP